MTPGNKSHLLWHVTLRAFPSDFLVWLQAAHYPLLQPVEYIEVSYI